MIHPFHVAVPDHVLRDVRLRLEHTRLPPDHDNDDWSYGVSANYMNEIVDYWLDSYDWTTQEGALNQWPQYRTEIKGTPIHFVHVKGAGYRPLPLILSHGWPWTFWDYHKIIGPLTDPAANGLDPGQSFDLVIPSLPGFGFSGSFLPDGNPPTLVADLWYELMHDRLGYEYFGAVGGDWGTYISQHLGHAHPDAVVGVHLSTAAFLGVGAGRPGREDFGPEEAGWYERLQHSLDTNVSHRWVNADEPQTASYGAHDSPVGLLATILDKRRRWGGGVHVEDAFTKDELLTTTMIYWVTETFASSVRYYAQRKRHPWTPVMQATPIVSAPTAVAVFPYDVIIQPRRIAETITNLVRWTVMPEGGHFAPMEQPELLVADLRAHFGFLQRSPSFIPTDGRSLPD